MTNPASDPTYTTLCNLCSIGCTVNIRADEFPHYDGIAGDALPDGCLYVSPGRNTELQPGERITRPLIRRGGRLEPADWDEALRLVAEKITMAAPHTSAFFAGARLTNEEMYLIQKLARTTGRTGYAGSFHYLGRGRNYTGLSKANIPFHELEEADAIWLIGARPEQNNPVAARYIAAAAAKGAAVGRVCRSSEGDTTQTYIRVSSYNHFVKAVNYIILVNNRQNDEYLGMLIDNFAEYKQQLLAADLGSLVNGSGLTESELQAFAARYTETAKSVLVFSEKECTANTCAELFNLAVLTGKHGKPGAGLLLLKESANSHGLHDMGMFPHLGLGSVDWENEMIRIGLKFSWAVDELAGFESDLEPKTLTTVRHFFIFGEDPVGCAEENGAVTEALRQAGFMLVQDYFLTETAQLADVVLPATFPYESGGSLTNTLKVIQLVQKHTPLVELQGWEQINRLIGLTGGKSFETATDIMLEIAQNFPKQCSAGKLRLRTTKSDSGERLFNHGCDAWQAHVMKG